MKRLTGRLPRVSEDTQSGRAAVGKDNLKEEIPTNE